MIHSDRDFSVENASASGAPSPSVSTSQALGLTGRTSAKMPWASRTERPSCSLTFCRVKVS